MWQYLTVKDMWQPGIYHHHVISLDVSDIHENEIIAWQPWTCQHCLTVMNIINIVWQPWTYQHCLTAMNIISTLSDSHEHINTVLQPWTLYQIVRQPWTYQHCLTVMNIPTLFAAMNINYKHCLTSMNIISTLSDSHEHINIVWQPWT